MPLRLDGVTSALTFFSDLFVENVPDGPATSARLFMYFLMLSLSLTSAASMMASMDDCFQAAALAGESLLRRLRVMRSTMGASPGSAGLDMVREEEAVNTLRGCRRLPVYEFGSITGGRARVLENRAKVNEGAPRLWCRVAGTSRAASIAISSKTLKVFESKPAKPSKTLKVGVQRKEE